MEHSAFHAFKLTGQIIALGGIFLVWGIVRPAARKLGASRAGFVVELQRNVERWIFWGALMSGLATLLGIFVEVAEVEGKTIFAGVNLSLFASFATKSTVGQREVARGIVLLFTALVAKLPAKARVLNFFKWTLVSLGLLTAIILTSYISHSAAQPTNRKADIIAQVAHITTVAIWMGILLQLLAARRLIEGDAGRANIGMIAEIVRRFSPVALTVTSLLFVSGIFMALHLVGTFGALVTSAYGLILLVKVSLILPAVYAGAVNFRVIRPQLLNAAHINPGNRREEAERGSMTRSGIAGFVAHEVYWSVLKSLGLLRLTEPRSKKWSARHVASPRLSQPKPELSAQKNPDILRRFGRMLELEATAGVMVILLAGILASVSPPGESGIYRLTREQTRALLTPRIPSAHYINPATFYGTPERTLADLRYSEFTHHWSGVMVGALGIFWLLQSFGGRTGKCAGYGWPFLVMPFMLFVAIGSDPELFVLGKVKFWEAMENPQLLEHKLGALLLITLVWLGWRDRRKSDTNRPLGYALPTIFILGGSLLLGHVHSTLNNEQLANLISLEHVIFGAFMIFAGLTRWLTLRGLFPNRLGNLLWPSLICGLGIFMAFFYREIT